MINGNWIILLLGLVAAFALSMDKKNKVLVENYGMPQKGKILLDPINANTMQSLPALPIQTAAIVGAGVTSPRLGNDIKGQFVAYPSFQASISPRFNSVGVGPYIRTKMPDQEHMATPKQALGYPNSSGIQVKRDAMDYSKMATKEGYCGSIGNGDFGGFMPPNYHADQQAYDEVASKLNKVNITDMIPVGDMSSVGSDGNIENVRVVDRYIYSNIRSRSLVGADPIRGDLPIVPCNRGWFSPSANPARDLQAGALAVMGGLSMDTTKDLWALQTKYSGGLGQTSSSIAGLGFDPPSFSGSKMALEQNLGMTASEGVNVVTAYNGPEPGRFNATATAFP